MKKNLILKLQKCFLKSSRSKKGFTLVELVVVIAIIAILAAIAIPVVSATVKSSVVSRAKANSHTIEVAFKEADAAAKAKDNTKYANASANTIKISDVVASNKIAMAFTPENLSGVYYYPVFCEGKVYFACDTNGDNKFDTNDKDIEDNALPGNAVVLYDKDNGCIVEEDISKLPIK